MSKTYHRNLNIILASVLIVLCFMILFCSCSSTAPNKHVYARLYSWKFVETRRAHLKAITPKGDTMYLSYSWYRVAPRFRQGAPLTIEYDSAAPCNKYGFVPAIIKFTK